MDNVNKTLYIPLYGKAQVSKRGIILSDPMAEKIWDVHGFPLKGKAKSKWLTLNMGMRAAVFDRWTISRAREEPDATVLHMGCGLDARILRTGLENEWYDMDFPEVIEHRRQFFPEQGNYHLLGADVREDRWLSSVPKGGTAILVMEGLSMYLTRQELLELLKLLSGHFDRVRLLMDCYTEFAAKATKYKNPINEVGVSQVYGLDDPHLLEEGTGFRFMGEHSLTPDDLVNQLEGMERQFFRKVFAGSFARRIYQLYEFESK